MEYTVEVDGDNHTNAHSAIMSTRDKAVAVLGEGCRIKSAPVATVPIVDGDGATKFGFKATVVWTNG